MSSDLLGAEGPHNSYSVNLIFFCKLSSEPSLSHKVLLWWPAAQKSSRDLEQFVCKCYRREAQISVATISLGYMVSITVIWFCKSIRPQALSSPSAFI